MSQLINQTGIKKYARSLNMRISKNAVLAVESRVKRVLKEAEAKARVKRRKTILTRDVEYEASLFD
jgi:histone H3/H4